MHFQGLAQASRCQSLGLPRWLRRHLLHLDVAHNLTRHITSVSAQRLLDEVTQELAPSSIGSRAAHHSWLRVPHFTLGFGSFHSWLQIPVPFFRKNYNFFIVKNNFHYFLVRGPPGAPGEAKKSKKNDFFFGQKFLVMGGGFKNFWSLSFAQIDDLRPPLDRE